VKQPTRSGAKRRLLGITVLAVIVVGCGSLPLTRPGQTPRPTPTPLPSFDPELTGFDGVVLDEEGNPLADVRLTIIEGRSRGTATTTADGTFFDRGTPGTLRITANLLGYQQEELTVVVAPDEIVEIEIVLVAND
jgi:Carboxypeptidase regulatory-like domain